MTSRPVTIRKGKDAATFVFKAADDAPDWKGFIKLKGTAGSLVREARSGARDNEFATADGGHGLSPVRSVSYQL